MIMNIVTGGQCEGEILLDSGKIRPKMGAIHLYQSQGQASYNLCHLSDDLNRVIR